MSESRVTILNQRRGKVVLPADPDELKKNPKAKARTLQAGESISVSAAEAPRLLRHKMLVDATTVLQGAQSPEVKRLKAELESEKARTAKLEQAAAERGDVPKDPADAAAAEQAKADKAAAKEAEKAAKAAHKLIMKKGAKVLLPDGTNTGVVVKVHQHKKGAADDTVDVKLDANGNVSPFNVADLKPAPQA